jgi:hypothetical protein
VQFGKDLFRDLFIASFDNELLAFDIVSVVKPADFVGELRVAFFGFGVRHAERFNAKSPRSKAASKRKFILAKPFGASDRQRAGARFELIIAGKKGIKTRA